MMGARGDILYCRVPGLLAQAAREGNQHVPAVAVAEGRLIRDVDAVARARGVRAGASVPEARRRCPPLLVVPREAVRPEALTRDFLDLLADRSPVVEPVGPDVAFAELAGSEGDLAGLVARLEARTGIPPVLGRGVSKTAARACGECGLPANRAAEASVAWLWPEDARVVGRLRRLGLETFAAVADIGEDALFYQFGRLGRLMHRRARGEDFDPVRPLYPPPCAAYEMRFDAFALADRQALQMALATAAFEVAEQLRAIGLVGRRVALRVGTERGELRREWVTPLPVQSAAEVTRAAQRLLMLLPVAAAVTDLGLRVADLEAPRAVTADLFAGRPHRDDLALAAARQVLAERYGPRAPRPLAERHRTVRERRREAERG